MLNKSVNFSLLGLLVALSLSNSVQAQQHHNSPLNPADTNNTMSQRMGDEHFLKMMVHHDQKTLKMVDLAMKKAKNTQIKVLATYIKIEQNQEIEQLQTLYKKLYGSEVPVSALNCMGGMGNNMSLASLENSPNFDQEFLQRMIHHQQMSVKMASKTAQNANSPQIRNLAQAIMKTQTDQIQKLQQL